MIPLFTPTMITRRTTALAALAVAGLLVGVPHAAASPPDAASQLAAARSEASVLASQIRADGVELEQMAEQADAATLYAAQEHAALLRAQRHLVGTDRALAKARVTLVAAAVDAYTTGGQSLLAPSSPAALHADPALVATYGDLAAGARTDAVDAYRSLRRSQASAAAALRVATRSADAAAVQLSADRQQAEDAQLARQQALAGITGQMATLVAAAQAEQAAAVQQAEQAKLASEGQLPDAHAAAATPSPSAPASTTSTTSGGPAAPAAAPTTPAPIPKTTPAPAPPAVTAPTTTVPTPPVTIPGAFRGAATVIAYARAQLGKPYQWGGAGPATFDCSGLVMDAFAAAGVYFPHLAQDQYNMTARVPIGQLLPGDLVFYGTPTDVYHVGIYIGGGDMIDAPATGQDVSIQNIYWSDLLSGGRVS